MSFEADLHRLVSDPRIRSRLPAELIERLEHIPTNNLQCAGSLLRTQLSAGSMGLAVPKMYLAGAPEAYKENWYSGCKVFADLCTEAVSKSFLRRIPRRVKDVNLASGATDVMDLPAWLATEAVRLLQKTWERAYEDYAVVLVLCITRLLGIEHGVAGAGVIPPASFRRFQTELVGATALYLLGVCPEDKLPASLVERAVAKLELELSKHVNL